MSLLYPLGFCNSHQNQWGVRTSPDTLEAMCHSVLKLCFNIQTALPECNVLQTLPSRTLR